MKTFTIRFTGPLYGLGHLLSRIMPGRFVCRGLSPWFSTRGGEIYPPDYYLVSILGPQAVFHLLLAVLKPQVERRNLVIFLFSYLRAGVIPRLTVWWLDTTSGEVVRQAATSFLFRELPTEAWNVGLEYWADVETGRFIVSNRGVVPPGCTAVHPCDAISIARRGAIRRGAFYGGSPSPEARAMPPYAALL